MSFKPHTISTAATLSEALHIIQTASSITEIIYHNCSSWVTHEDRKDARQEFIESILLKIHKGTQTEGDFLAFFNRGQEFLYWTVRLFRNKLLSTTSSFQRRYKRRTTDEVNDEITKDHEPQAYDLDPMDLLDLKLIEHLLHSDQAVAAKITPEQAQVYLKGFLPLVYDQSKKSKFPSAQTVAEYLGQSPQPVGRALRKCKTFLRAYYRSLNHE